MQLTDQQIYDTVISTVANSLALDKDEIKEQSRLIADLGMDSLDFVDIIFTLEQSFGTKVRDSELNKLLRPDKAKLAQMPEYLTEEEIDQFLPLLPQLSQSLGDAPIKRQNIFEFITVETLVIMVKKKISAQ